MSNRVFFLTNNEIYGYALTNIFKRVDIEIFIINFINDDILSTNDILILDTECWIIDDLIEQVQIIESFCISFGDINPVVVSDLYKLSNFICHIPTTSSISELESMIKTALNKRKLFLDSVKEEMINAVYKEENYNPREILSKKELHAMKLLGKGASYEEIASTLSLKLYTAKNMSSGIRKKLIPKEVRYEPLRDICLNYNLISLHSPKCKKISSIDHPEIGNVLTPS